MWSHIPTVNVESPFLERISIAFSSKFMLDALRVLESTDMKLFFNGELKPIIIKNPESDDLVQLILPIRTY